MNTEEALTALKSLGEGQLKAFEVLRAHIELAEAQIAVHQVLLHSLLRDPTSADVAAIRSAFDQRIEPMSNPLLPAEYRARFISEFELALPLELRLKVFSPTGHFEPLDAGHPG